MEAFDLYADGQIAQTRFSEVIAEFIGSFKGSVHHELIQRIYTKSRVHQEANTQALLPSSSPSPQPFLSNSKTFLERVHDEAVRTLNSSLIKSSSNVKSVGSPLSTVKKYKPLLVSV
jgi:hypothetical protein